MYWQGVVCRYSNERLTTLIIFYFSYFAGYDMTQYFVYVYVAGWCRENATAHRRHWRPQRIYAHDQEKEKWWWQKRQPTSQQSCLLGGHILCAWRKISQTGYQELFMRNFIERNLLGLQNSVLLLPVGRLIHHLEAMRAYLSAYLSLWNLLEGIDSYFFDSSYVLHFWLNNWIRHSVYALLFFNEPSIQMRIYGFSIINIRRGSQRKTLSFSIRKLKTLRSLVENQWGSQKNF